MSSRRNATHRAAARWVRWLATTITVGLLAAIGVSLGAYGRGVAVVLSDVAVDSAGVWPTTAVPNTLSLVAAVVYDGSVLAGILAVTAAGWLGVVLAVRVGAGVVASVVW